MTLILLLKPGLGVEQNILFANEDKVVHLGLFLSLTLLWFRYFNQELSIALDKVVLLVLITGFVLSAGTELLQDFVPGRETDFIDFIFNMGGVAIGVVFSYILEKRNQTLVK
jgi:VanZ family protein